MDILTVDKRDYFVLYDTYSYWLEIIPLKSKTAAEVIRHLKSLFSRYGTPTSILSDNNPFNCSEYLAFAETWNFTPIFSSPHHSQGNGFAEKGVSVAKSILLKNTDLDHALLQYRIAPVPHIRHSPAQLFYNRDVKSMFPVPESFLQSAIPDSQQVMASKAKACDTSKEHFDRHTRPLPPLSPGQAVYVKRDLSDKVWKTGIVASHGDTPRSYVVQEDSGATLKRNRRFLRPVKPPNHLLTQM